MGLRAGARAGGHPRSASVLNNLCYLSLEEGKSQAERANGRLPRIPSLTTARPRSAGAEKQLSENANNALGRFNVGMLRMSMGRYTEAAEAFDVVVTKRPESREAHSRAAQARAQIVAQREP